MENSKIEWTDHTFNPWRGCTPVSPGCANCYAAAMSKRTGGPEYRKGATRIRTSPDNWKKPLKWNREAETFAQCDCGFAGEIPFEFSRCPECDSTERLTYRRPRVFCASLADWLDAEVPIEWMADLLDLIRSTPYLDWLMLTKRPENWRPRLIDAREVALDRQEIELHSFIHHWIARHDIAPPSNIWIGATVENQDQTERHGHLMAIPAKVHFWSSEPMLSQIDPGPVWALHGKPDWVICGGESGPKSRPMHPDWARSLRDQCKADGVPFLFKQWGEWEGMLGTGNYRDIEKIHSFGDGHVARRVGKKAAGRLLDGVEHNGYPMTQGQRQS